MSRRLRAAGSTGTRYRPTFRSRCGPQDFEHSKAPDLLQSLTRSLPFTSLENQSGNPFQQDFNYRGFVASPVPGTPQGIAVYQNGVRINEAYGDVVNWAFLPEVAINKLTLQPNNPVFGLNAIGGAVSIDMKNGFNYHGTQFDALSGMYGRLTGTVQSGIQNGNLSIYAAADATNDRGWRDHSSSSYLRRMYTDLGAKGEQSRVPSDVYRRRQHARCRRRHPAAASQSAMVERLHLAADNASATRLRAGDRSLEPHR